MKRILVIGAGLIGSRHVRHVEAHPGCILAGVVDPNPDAIAGLGCKGFSTIEEVDVLVDGAIISTPTALHLEHAQQCAERHWNLLIEKPVAETLGEAQQIVDLAKKCNVQTLVGHHRRHHSRVKALKRIVESGQIGLPIGASLIWAMKKPDEYFEGNWREGPHGSPVLINLVHDVDLLRYVLGEVRNVTGFGGRRLRGKERVESGVAALEFESGCVASLLMSDNAPSPWGFEAGTGENPNIGKTAQDMLWITGTDGAVSFPSLTVWSGAADWSTAVKATEEQVEVNTPLVAQLEHFCAVMEGRETPLISAADGMRSLNIALSIEQAFSGKASSEAAPFIRAEG